MRRRERTHSVLLIAPRQDSHLPAEGVAAVLSPEPVVVKPTDDDPRCDADLGGEALHVRGRDEVSEFASSVRRNEDVFGEPVGLVLSSPAIAAVIDEGVPLKG